MLRRGTCLMLMCLMLLVLAMASTAFAEKVVVVPAELVTGRPSVQAGTDPVLEEALRDLDLTVIAGEPVVTAMEELGLEPGTLPSVESLMALREKMDVDFVMGPGAHTWSNPVTVGLTRHHKGNCDWRHVVVGREGVVDNYVTDPEHPWAVQNPKPGDPWAVVGLVAGAGMAGGHFFPEWSASRAVGWTLAGVSYLYLTRAIESPEMSAGVTVGALVASGTWFPYAGPVAKAAGWYLVLLPVFYPPSGNPEVHETIAVQKAIHHAVVLRADQIFGPREVATG